MAGDKTTIFDHEIRLVKIETTLEAVKENIDTNTTLTKEGFDKMTTLLQGDNGEGLVTKVAKNSQSVNRLWWLIPILMTLGTTVLSYAVK